MRLPVIQACGECGHRNFNLCDNPEAITPSGSFRIDPLTMPPAWCPMRTGPDAERIAALEAVAAAAVPFVGGTAVSARRGASLADTMALDAALARLRSLT